MFFEPNHSIDNRNIVDKLQSFSIIDLEASFLPTFLKPGTSECTFLLSFSFELLQCLLNKRVATAPFSTIQQEENKWILNRKI